MGNIKIMRGDFEPSNTVNFSAHPDDILMHCRPNIFAESQDGGVIDFWFFHGGEQIWITDESKNFPSEFELHPTEVSDELAFKMLARIEAGWKPGEPSKAPNYWRLLSGDHIILAGDRTHSLGKIAVFDFILETCALAYWLPKDGIQPSSIKQAAVPRAFDGNAKAKEYAGYALDAFSKSPLPRTMSTDWTISS